MWPCLNSRPAVLTLLLLLLCPPPLRWPMRILFDHGTPALLIPFLEGHTITKAKDAGWERLVNGDLLRAAEQAGFDVLLTTDKDRRRSRI